MKKRLILLASILVLASCSREKLNSVEGLESQKPRGEFVQGAVYEDGDIVEYQGVNYQCIKATTSIPGTTEAWLRLDARAEWASGVSYSVGDIVTYKGKTYKCIMNHQSNGAWYPTAAPSIWVETDSGSGGDTGGNTGGDTGNNGGDTNTGNYVTWQSGQVYNEGDLVLHNNKKWLCKWYTNTEPGTTGQWGPWEEVVDNGGDNGGTTNPTGDLITSITKFTNKVDVGRSQSIYVQGVSGNTYTWSLVEKPANSSLTINSTSTTLRFTPDSTGTYRFKVEAKNGSKVETTEVKVEANRAIALINGIDYPGNDIKCEVDLGNIRKILDPADFTVNELRSSQVVKNNIFAELDKMANLLEPGDIFVFYFSGHGSKIPESTTSAWGLPKDEADGVDETLFMYNREHLIDDELDVYWKKFKKGVRIITIADSCHSGTVYKSIEAPINFNMSRSYNIDTRAVMQAELIHFSGCQDAELSYGNNTTGGVFTNALVDSYRSGSYSSYPALYNNVIAKFTYEKQMPDYNEYNASTAFVNSKPFSR